MTTEGEAQKLLREYKIERGPDDPRSCLQVAIAAGLVATRADLEVELIIEDATVVEEKHSRFKYFPSGSAVSND